MGKTEITGVKTNIGLLNIDHIEIGSIDLGLKGKQNWLGLLALGLIFQAISNLPLGGIGSWLYLFSLLLIIGAIVQFIRTYINPNFGKSERNYKKRSRRR